MKHRIHRLIALAAALSLSSCMSCYSVRMTPAEMADAGLPIGTVIEAKKMLYASLEEHIDGEYNITYVSEQPYAKKHYVLKKFSIPTGTRFEVMGFLRPRNFMCSSIYAVLKPSAPLEPSGAEVNVRLEETPDGTFIFNPQMFRKVGADNNPLPLPLS